MAPQSDPAKNIEARRKYAKAFNDTLIAIWKERVVKLGIFSGRKLKDGALNLYGSILASQLKVNSDFTEMFFEQKFNEYGIYVDAGTGREVYKGNPGDIGRDKKRVAKKWFYPKYYMSFANIRDFMAENLGQQVASVITNALTEKFFRESLR